MPGYGITIHCVHYNSIHYDHYWTVLCTVANILTWCVPWRVLVLWGVWLSWWSMQWIPSSRRQRQLLRMRWLALQCCQHWSWWCSRWPETKCTVCMRVRCAHTYDLHMLAILNILSYSVCMYMYTYSCTHGCIMHAIARPYIIHCSLECFTIIIFEWHCMWEVSIWWSQVV